MTIKISVATGPFSTAANWNNAETSRAIHASTNQALSNAADYYTVNFAGTTGRSLTGVLVYVAAAGAGTGSISIILQEKVGAGAFADVGVAVTETVSNIFAYGNTPTTWLFRKFNAAYAMTTGNSYRVRIRLTAAATATCSLGGDGTPSGSETIFGVVTNNTAAVPGSGDDIWVVGDGYGTPYTITVDDTSRICGSRAATALGSARTLTNAVNIAIGGILKWSTTASALLTCRGNFYCYKGSIWRMDDGAGGAYPTGQVATLTFSMATSGDHGFYVDTYATVSLIGEPKTTTALWKTHPNANWSVGQGVTGNTAVVADTVNWAANDELVISPTAAVNQTELKFIKTIATGNTLIFSDTAGGAESGLSYAHSTDAWILNLARNVVITTDDVTKAPYGYEAGTYNYINIGWVRFEYGGVTTSNKQAAIAFQNSIINYCVGYKPLLQSFYAIYVPTTLITATGLVSVKGTATSGNYGGIQCDAIAFRNFTDCFVIGSGVAGFREKSYGGIWTNCHAIDCNSGAAAGYAGWWLGSMGAQYNNCEAHGNRNQGILLGQSVANAIWTGGKIGTIITHTTNDITPTAAYYQDFTLINTLCGSASLIGTAYANITQGSKFAFHNLNITTYNDQVYLPSGIIYCCGAGLTDTTTRTAGNHAIRLSPKEAIYGLKWSFYVVAKALSAVPVYGFLKRRAAPCTINLYKVGSTTPDYTQTWADTTDADWQQWFVTVTNTTSIPELYKVEIVSAKAGTPGINDVWIADIFNGTNQLSALNIWQNGLPASMIYDQLGDAGAVWAYALEGSLSAGDLQRLTARANAANMTCNKTTGAFAIRDLANTKDSITGSSVETDTLITRTVTGKDAT